jgi:hypothetical protein
VMEDLQVRHRSRLRHHFTTTSNVLLFGYRQLSDGAKLTYQVIDSFDWEDDNGLRKGYAYPSLARVALGRGVSERTVQRHLAELEAAGWPHCREGVTKMSPLSSLKRGVTKMSPRRIQRPFFLKKTNPLTKKTL